jgi:cation diffusion facilitator family transporter
MAGCNDCPGDALASDNANNPRFRVILWIALLANLTMFGVEIVASWWGDSMALQADALDFFGDAANYGISLFVLGMALQWRSYAALFKGATMAAFGTWVIFSAAQRAISGSEPDPMTMGGIATLALAVNVGVALLLYRYRGGDSNARSIWLCSRNDAIGNIAVLGAALSVFALGSRWPDLLVAVLIAALNLSAALQVVRQALEELRHGSVIPPGQI